MLNQLEDNQRYSAVVLKKKKRKKHECQNLKCIKWNKQIGFWRSDNGIKRAEVKAGAAAA